MLEKVVVFFIVLFITISTVSGSNELLVEYFTHNIVARTLVAGGYYTLALIAILIIAALASKVFRKILLSVLFALFGLMLVIFFFRALGNFQFLPN
jgi:hypothetical protein